MTELKPLLDLLGGKSGWFATALVWFAALRTALSFFDTRIRHWVSDRVNAAAATQEGDDDELLRELFSRRWWKIAALVFPLPKIADLERAVKQQQEAARAAQVQGTRP